MAEELSEGYLLGQLLVAMPTMRDPRFTRSVIYLCAHNADGAMGLVLNRLVGSLTFPDLLAQLGIDRTEGGRDIRVHFGGPVDTGRGFVPHSPDYSDDGTTYAYETGKSEITHLHWDNVASKLEHTGASAWSKPDGALVEIVGKAARD